MVSERGEEGGQRGEDLGAGLLDTAQLGWGEGLGEVDSVHPAH